MLPEPYKKALLALQDQAKAAIRSFTDENMGKEALADAHRRMSECDKECKEIVRLVMKSTDQNLTIPTLTEERLAKLLGL